jgi:hypothetical protein
MTDEIDVLNRSDSSVPLCARHFSDVPVSHVVVAHEDDPRRPDGVRSVCAKLNPSSVISGVAELAAFTGVKDVMTGPSNVNAGENVPTALLIVKAIVCRCILFPDKE